MKMLLAVGENRTINDIVKLSGRNEIEFQKRKGGVIKWQKFLLQRTVLQTLSL